MDAIKLSEANKLNEALKKKGALLGYFADDDNKPRTINEADKYHPLMDFFTSCRNLGDRSDRVELYNVAITAIVEHLKNEHARLESDFEAI